ncbi:MAG: DNA-directed RNA polymerase core subunit rpc40, partial [Paramarteilia canceri]
RIGSENVGRFYENEKFSQRMFDSQTSIQINTMNDLEIELELIGYETAFVNALRRIMISEVPTICAEKIHLYQNTSIIQDEVLCHRLGLIPLKIDPELLDMPEDGNFNERNSIELELNIKCYKDQEANEIRNKNGTGLDIFSAYLIVPIF